MWPAWELALHASLACAAFVVIFWGEKVSTCIHEVDTLCYRLGGGSF